MTLRFLQCFMVLAVVSSSAPAYSSTNETDELKKQVHARFDDLQKRLDEIRKQIDWLRKEENNCERNLERLRCDLEQIC